MTDNFLQKFEEKVMVLLAELETVRKEVIQLRLDNANLKSEKLNYTKKLQALVSLFDTLNAPEQHHAHEAVNAEEEFATA